MTRRGIMHETWPETARRLGFVIDFSRSVVSRITEKRQPLHHLARSKYWPNDCRRAGKR